MKKIAVPTYMNQLTPHFGHCEKFAIVHVDNNTVGEVEYVDPPVHQPGVYPAFLASIGVNAIIAGGMGQKARDLFAQNNIEVILGVNQGKPEELTRMYLDNMLVPGENKCDH